MNKAVQINKSDNVAIALTDLKKDEIVSVAGEKIRLTETVIRGHKFALCNVNEGCNVIKYGFPIGRAKRDIVCGEWVHTHNLRTNLDISSERYSYKKNATVSSGGSTDSLFFNGFPRLDGSVGIRNELWLVPMVGCVNGICEQIVRKFRKQVPEIYADDIRILKHSFGCSQLGGDLENTRRILSDFVRHPNAGGVLVVSLGCENNTLPEFIKEIGQYDKRRVRFLCAQDQGDEIEAGANFLAELNSNMRADKRKAVPLSSLRVGLKCGGSDGLSGITANPLIGRFTDFLTKEGGTAILTEVPEMFGAETILMERARDESVFNQIVELIQNFKNYYKRNNQPIYENPSPGNKAGGITTLEDKALGCTQKSGSAQVQDVLNYGGKIQKNGLNLLCAPGNDLVSSTALAAAGCQIVLFSTGRGTPFGTVVPTIKISSNTQLFCSKPGWIDFNAGEMENENLLKELINLVLNVANGKPSKNESNGFSEIAIWKKGVTL